MATDKQETRIVTPMGDRALGVNQLIVTKTIATGETPMNKNNDGDNDTGYENSRGGNWTASP